MGPGSAYRCMTSNSSLAPLITHPIREPAFAADRLGIGLADAHAANPAVAHILRGDLDYHFFST